MTVYRLMELEKLGVKFFISDPDEIPLTKFIDVFHGWIQATDGIYHDVADYSHMHAGPGIVLVSHEAHVSIDETGERRGLLYSRKMPLEGSNQERLRLVFRYALENWRKIEEDPLLQGKIRFRGEENLLLVNDRLLAPNNDDTFVHLKPDLDNFFRRLYRGSPFSLERELNLDPRQRFSVAVRSAKSFGVADLLSHLAEEDLRASSL